MKAKFVNESFETKFVSKFVSKKLDKIWDFFEDGEFIKFSKNEVDIEIGLEYLENGECAIFLNDILTHPYYQRKGYASKILKEITNYADNHNAWMALRASVQGHYSSPTFINQEQLIKWYEKNGFKLDPFGSVFGEDKIFMTREPN